MSNIYSAISSCMAEIGAVEKGQRNKQQGFMYRGIDDVMKALQPLLVKNKIFIVPEVLEKTREERKARSGGNLISTIMRVKYTFYADDGSSVSATVVGEGMDSGDKSANKAMSVALKYAILQVFCIPTEENDDPDADTPPPSEPMQQLTCKACSGLIKGGKKPDGTIITSEQMAGATGGLCRTCYKEEQRATGGDN